MLGLPTLHPRQTFTAEVFPPNLECGWPGGSLMRTLCSLPPPVVSDPEPAAMVHTSTSMVAHGGTTSHGS